MSSLDANTSALTIGSGLANALLVFTADALATRDLVEPKVMASAFMAHHAAAISDLMFTYSAPTATFFAAEALATTILDEASEHEVEDLKAEEQVVISLSHAGYIKRVSIALYRRRVARGKAQSGLDRHGDDFLEHVFVAGSFDDASMEAAIRENFADWNQGAEFSVPLPDAKSQRAVYLVDRPDAEQSTVYIGLPVVGPSHEDYLKLLRGEKTALCTANSAHEIIQVCELARAYNFRLAVAGAVETVAVGGTFLRKIRRITPSPSRSAK